MANKTLTEQLHDLRVAYEKETNTKKNTYALRLKNIEDKITEVKNRDYSVPYKEKYKQLYGTVGIPLATIMNIEGATHGLKKKFADYYKEATVYNVDGLKQGKVEEVFQWVIAVMSDVVDRLQQTDTMAEFGQVLAQYAKVLITAEEIHNNADKHLKASGLPEGERASDLKILTEEKHKVETERDNALKLENLDCYPVYQSVYKQYKANYARVSEDILGSENERMYFDTEYRYLIGFYLEKISDEDKKFAKEILRINDAELSCSPVYFEPEKGQFNIVINAKAEEFEKPLYKKFINQFYFSMARRLPANSLKYTAIACNESTNGVFVSAMNNFIKKLSDSNLYIEQGVVNTPSNVPASIKDLRSKSLQFTTEDNSSIYEFNRKSSVDRKPFYLTYVDSYPLELKNQLDGITSLQQLMKEGGKSGFITVLSQAIDKFEVPKQDALKDLPPKFENVDAVYNAMEIQISGENVTVNGKPVRLNIADPSFTDNAYVQYWTKLKSYYNKKEIFYLERLFDDLDVKKRRMDDDEKSVLETGKMSIPLGYVGTELYEVEYNLNKACHAFIWGDSGSGKSSFLHTFIMGLTYKYSPKEVQLYLADWKKAEFNAYKENPLPHIRYIQDNSTLPEYVSLLHMMLRICAQRNELIQSKGETSFLGYNRRVPESQRLPFILFIIDEYQVMLEQSKALKSNGVRRQVDTWQSLMNSILGIVRSAGIGVVLSSQSMKDVDVSVDNVEKRFLLGSNKDLLTQHLYHNSRSDDAEELITQDEQYLSVKQSGHVVLGFRGSSVTQRFRAAYTGEGEVRVKAINRINQRFPERYEQLILGGSKEDFSISEPTIPPYKTILDPVKKDVSESDDDFDFEMYDDTAYPVYVGVTSNDMTPVSLQFSTKGNAYVAYTQSETRLRLLTRDVMLSFLYKTMAHKGKYDCLREYYFGSEDDYRRDIGGVCNRKEFLNDHIKHCDTEFDSYTSVCMLMELYSVYLARKERRKEKGGFAPVLAVFHDVEWIAQKLEDTFNAYEREAERRRDSANSDEDTEQVDLKNNPRLEEIIQEIRDSDCWPEEMIEEMALAQLEFEMGGNKPVQKEKKKEKVYTQDEVQEAFKVLFKEGCRYRIFVFMGSTVCSDLKNLHDRVLKNISDAAFEKYAVFGSQQENEGKFAEAATAEGDVNTCFVYPVPEPKVSGVSLDAESLQVGVLTRLYKYSLSDVDFWDTLERGLEDW